MKVDLTKVSNFVPREETLLSCLDSQPSLTANDHSTLANIGEEKNITVIEPVPAVPAVPVFGESESENNYPAQLVCYWCRKPLMENDWEIATDGFTGGKEAHKSCNVERRALLKKPEDDDREYSNQDDNPREDS